MELLLDCIPCLLNQALKVSRLVTDDPHQQEMIVNLGLNILQHHPNYDSSPALARDIHNMVKEVTGLSDPYETIKRRDMNLALALYPKMKSFLADQDDPLYWALKISATGNNIDAAIMDNVDIEHVVDVEIKKAFAHSDLALFTQRLVETKNLLIIGDNAGETVFDRVLIEYLHSSWDLNVFYGVRDNPIINDTTHKEAVDSGLDTVATLISTGCDAPGAIIDQCSDEFRSLFEKADLIISKGQGNFEALSEENKPIFFLLKAKCPMIALRLGARVGDYLLKFKA